MKILQWYDFHQNFTDVKEKKKNTSDPNPQLFIFLMFSDERFCGTANILVK